MSTALVESKFSIQDMEHMAHAIKKGGLFGYNSPEEVFTLLLIADAEGIHPAMAMRRYHIIKGKPTLRADAMLADFIARGGKVEWVKSDNITAEANFTAGNGMTFQTSFTIEDARTAKIYKTDSNWTKYPDAMLRARLISKAIRMVDPGAIVGMYTPEEMGDSENHISQPFGHKVADARPREVINPEPINVTPELIKSESEIIKKSGAMEVKADKAQVIKSLHKIVADIPSDKTQPYFNIINEYLRMRNVKSLDNLDVDDLISIQTGWLTLDPDGDKHGDTN